VCMVLSMSDNDNYNIHHNESFVNLDPMGEIRAYRAPGYLLHILEVNLYKCTT